MTGGGPTSNATADVAATIAPSCGATTEIPPTHRTERTTMTTTPTPDPLARMELMLQNLELAGIDPAELAAFAEHRDSTGAVTVATFLADRVIPALSKGQRAAWGAYVPVVTEGLPHLCSCFCEGCLTAFKGNSKWDPCPCVLAGHCACTAEDLGKGAAASGSCLESCTALGDKALASVFPADWNALARWNQLRAQKRTAVRNRTRGAAGRPTFNHDGRSSVEHLRNLVGAIYKLALGDRVPGIRENLATEIPLQPRPAPEARSYSEAQLAELWNALFTSGSNDVELDMAITWFGLETGARRGGPIGLRVADLHFHAGTVELGEKNEKHDNQPVTDRLLAFLLGHALRRGEIVVANPENLALEAITVADVASRRVLLRTDAPVFYYKSLRKVEEPDGTLRFEPRPLSRKRFETLWGRLKRELPWLDELHGRPHDLRNTMGTFVERAFGHAVAQGWLRHSTDDVTGLYTMAGPEAIEAAHRWLVGE